MSQAEVSLGLLYLCSGRRGGWRMALEILVWVLECFGQQPNLLLDFLIFGTPESVGQQRVAFRLVPPGEATSQFCSETTTAKPSPPLHQPLQIFSTPEMLHLWSEAASDQRSCCTW